MRDPRRRHLSTAAAAVMVAAAVMSAAPAAAVQTSTYKLAATGARTKMVHGYGSGAVHDTFVVANLSGAALTLALDVVSATLQPNGDYALGPSGQGFAAKVTLPARSVSLAPHEQRILPVVIHRPEHTGQALYAAITAQPHVAPAAGIGVPLRLALLVEIAPKPESTGGTSTATSVERVVAIVVAAALVAGLMLMLVRRRRGSGSPA